MTAPRYHRRDGQSEERSRAFVAWALHAATFGRGCCTLTYHLPPEHGRSFPCMWMSAVAVCTLPISTPDTEFRA